MYCCVSRFYRRYRHLCYFHHVRSAGQYRDQTGRNSERGEMQRNLVGSGMGRSVDRMIIRKVSFLRHVILATAWFLMCTYCPSHWTFVRISWPFFLSTSEDLMKSSYAQHSDALKNASLNTRDHTNRPEPRVSLKCGAETHWSVRCSHVWMIDASYHHQPTSKSSDKMKCLILFGHTRAQPQIYRRHIAIHGFRTKVSKWRWKCCAAGFGRIPWWGGDLTTLAQHLWVFG